jgi:hypothetical protein
MNQRRVDEETEDCLEVVARTLSNFLESDNNSFVSEFSSNVLVVDLFSFFLSDGIPFPLAE